MQMKRRQEIPTFVTRGVDIYVDKIVKRCLEGAKKTESTSYQAFVCSRDESAVILQRLMRPDSRPWWCSWMVRPYNEQDSHFRSLEEVAQAIQGYVDRVKYDYRLSEFKYKINLHDRMVTETRMSVASRDKEKIVGLLEDLLK